MNKERECSLCAGSGLALGPGFSRRRFFQVAGTGLVASYFLDVVSPKLLYGATAAPNVALKNSAKSCIFIFLPGAPSHVDTWDFKEGSWTPSDFAPDTFGGGNIRFPKGLMPKTAEHIDQLAFVRSGLSWAAVHQLGQSWAQIARNPGGATGAIAPHIGAVVSIESQTQRTVSDVLPGFIALNSGSIPMSGYLPATYAPFEVTTDATGLATLSHPDGASRFTDRWTFLHQLDTNRATGALGKHANDMNNFYDSAKTLMDAPGINNLFAFSTDDHTKYGSSDFGDSLIVARNLVNARKGTRFVQATVGGWDHHSDIYAANNSLFSQCKTFDAAFGALMNDLRTTPGSAAGATLLDETIIFITAEFG